MVKRASARNPAVRGSRSGRPIMALLDLLGRRWTLKIVWELRDGALTSRALRAACGDASPTVMQQRLSELRESGFVEMCDEGGYELTAMGRDLLQTSLPLYQFAERWRARSGS
jgi:DNA-binding HxlR family transcriptional regulator